MAKKKKTNETVEMTPEEIQGTKIVQESTVEVIDAYMLDFCKFTEDKNVGELRAIRGLLERKMLEADQMGGNILQSSNVSNFNKEQRTTLANVFTVVAKISDKIGYIDYLLEKRKLDMDK